MPPRIDARARLLPCLSETRIGPLHFLTSTYTEPLGYVTSSSHRASVDSCREVTSGLVLFTQEDPLTPVPSPDPTADDPSSIVPALMKN